MTSFQNTFFSAIKKKQQSVQAKKAWVHRCLSLSLSLSCYLPSSSLSEFVSFAIVCFFSLSVSSLFFCLCLIKFAALLFCILFYHSECVFKSTFYHTFDTTQDSLFVMSFFCAASHTHTTHARTHTHTHSCADSRTFLWKHTRAALSEGMESSVQNYYYSPAEVWLWEHDAAFKRHQSIDKQYIIGKKNRLLSIFSLSHSTQNCSFDLHPLFNFCLPLLFFRSIQQRDIIIVGKKNYSETDMKKIEPFLFLLLATFFAIFCD